MRELSKRVKGENGDSSLALADVAPKLMPGMEARDTSGFWTLAPNEEAVVEAVGVEGRRKFQIRNEAVGVLHVLELDTETTFLVSTASVEFQLVRGH